MTIQTAILTTSIRWHRFRLAETDASDHAPAACYRRLKHIRVAVVVVAELILREILRHIFGVHLVKRAERSDDSA
jgi:hypothetical protein